MTISVNPPVTPVATVDPRAPGFAPGPLEPPSEPKASLLSFAGDKPGASKTKATESAPPLLLVLALWFAGTQRLRRL